MRSKRCWLSISNPDALSGPTVYTSRYYLPTYIESMVSYAEAGWADRTQGRFAQFDVKDVDVAVHPALRGVEVVTLIFEEAK